MDFMEGIDSCMKVVFQHYKKSVTQNFSMLTITCYNQLLACKL